MRPLKIVNSYGNVEAAKLPKGYALIDTFRWQDRVALQRLLTKAGIANAPAVTGWKGKERYGFKPDLGGVVVAKRSAGKAQIALRFLHAPPLTGYTTGGSLWRAGAEGDVAAMAAYLDWLQDAN